MRVPEFDTVHAYLAHWATHRPHAEAAVHGDVRMTWRELKSQADTATAALRSHGLERGDRMSLRSDPTIDFFVWFLGASQLGVMFHGVGPKSSRREVEYVLGDVQPHAVINLCDDGFAWDELVDVLQDRPAVLSMSDLQTAQAADGQTSSYAKPDDVLCVVHTSGTSGEPKGALVPHRGAMFCSILQVEHFFDDGEVRAVCNFPIDHIGSLVDVLGSVIVTGGTAVFQPRFDADELLDLTEREEVRYWLAVPAMLTKVVESSRWADVDLSSMYRIICGGAPVPLQIAEQLSARGVRLGANWGLTETSGAISYTSDDQAFVDRVRSLGFPDSRVELKVVDASGNECAVGEPGEFLVRGNFLMRGYLGKPEATKAVIDADGWFHTSDIGIRRADGSLEMVGRTTERVKSGGYNVYPREVELILERFPGVEIAVVVPVQDDVWDEVGHAFLQGDPDAVRVDDVEAFARGELANYKVPKGFVVVRKLPITRIGKVDRARLTHDAAALRCGRNDCMNESGHQELTGDEKCS